MATTETARELSRERARRSDYDRSTWQRWVDFYALTPTVGVGFYLGAKTFLVGLWMLRPYPIYRTSVAWAWFAQLGVPESVLGAAMMAAGFAMAWCCRAVRAEQYPGLRFAAGLAQCLVWGFLLASFAQQPAAAESLWIPICGLNALASSWIVVRTGFAPRRHQGPSFRPSSFFPPAAPTRAPGASHPPSDGYA